MCVDVKEGANPPHSTPSHTRKQTTPRTCSQKTEEMRRATRSKGSCMAWSAGTSVAQTPSSKSIVSTRARVWGHTMAGICFGLVWGWLGWLVG